MSQFFHSMASDWRPVSEIQAIGPLVQTVGQMKFAIVTMRNGEDIRLADYELEDLLHRPLQIMPAEPGTKLVHYLVDAHAVHWTVPLTGWALCMDGITRPMTAGGPVSDSSEHPYGIFIEMPDGSVTQVGPNGDEHEDADMMLRLLVQRSQLNNAAATEAEGSEA
jgi:hypothetical protein